MAALTVLVTGANGFVGRTLVPMLEKDGWQMRLQRRKPDIKVTGKYAWHDMDLLDTHADLKGLTRGIDVIVHLAGRTHAAKTIAPLAEAAVTTGVKRFIFLSTIKVNGEGYFSESTSQQVYTELSSPDPQSEYGRDQWAAEQLLMQICGRSAMTYTIIRPPLVFGPGLTGNFLALLKVVSLSIPLPLAAIKNRRSFMYVENLCSLIIKAAWSPVAGNKTYVTADLTVSTPALIRRLAEALNVRARLFPVPISLLKMAAVLTGQQAMLDRLVNSLVIDDNRVRRELGWKPRVDSETALHKTVVWYLNEMNKLKKSL